MLMLPVQPAGDWEPPVWVEGLERLDRTSGARWILPEAGAMPYDLIDHNIRQSVLQRKGYHLTTAVDRLPIREWGESAAPEGEYSPLEMQLNGWDHTAGMHFCDLRRKT
jgi:hypothetical protein